MNRSLTLKSFESLGARAALVVILATVSSMAIPGGTAWAADAERPPESTQARRLQSVHSLIEESSAAKRIEQSRHADAKARREAARALLAQAKAANDANDSARADELLNQASRTMFEAVRLAEQDGSMRAKKETDFDNRLSSVNALVLAYERICDEKHCPAAERGEVRRGVDDRIQESRRLRDRGDIDPARSRLDQAYVAIKVAIEHRRSGDTLVRSLQFKSKEEEYRYELDRNDTHRMLIRILAEDRVQGTAAAAMHKLLDDAAVLRAQAEKEAESGRFENAVQTLEGATRELQKALRGAGIYIPG